MLQLRQNLLDSLKIYVQDSLQGKQTPFQSAFTLFGLLDTFKKKQLKKYEQLNLLILLFGRYYSSFFTDIILNLYKLGILKLNL